jgi:hypothetical protein
LAGWPQTRVAQTFFAKFLEPAKFEGFLLTLGVVAEPTDLRYVMCEMKRMSNLKDVETFRAEKGGIPMVLPTVAAVAAYGIYSVVKGVKSVVTTWCGRGAQQADQQPGAQLQGEPEEPAVVLPPSPPPALRHRVPAQAPLAAYMQVPGDLRTERRHDWVVGGRDVFPLTRSLVR